MIEFIEDTSICKNKLLLTYFNQETNGDCEICSTCLSKNKKLPLDSSVQIIDLLLTNHFSSKEIENKLSITSEETIFALQQLLEKNKIAINLQNKYYLI
jgi:ATP-dependent DNA helicase RecQ